MRCALHVTMPNPEGSAALKTGKLSEMLGAFMEKWKPEAMYFFPRHGKRSMFMILNVNDASQLPALSEMFFMQLNAEVELVPAMNLEDLKKGLSALEK